jgi:hypothetical protein
MEAERRHFEIFADHFQFHIQDVDAVGIRPRDWLRRFPQASGRPLLAAGDGAIRVGTFRNRVVAVDVEVLGTAPDEPLDPWDYVVDCSLAVTTGQVAIAGCTENLTRASPSRREPTAPAFSTADCRR